MAVKKKKAKAKSRAPKLAAGYEKHKLASAALEAEKSRSGRDIAPIPAVVNPERKERCRESLERFCREYLPQKFYLPWSEDHRKAISKIEASFMSGGLFAFAMPRGGGKSALVVAGYLWAMLFAHQEFVFVLGSDEAHAADLLQAGKSELENNGGLLEDFPEVCYPVRRMEGIAQRANGQLCEGKRTHLGWKEKELIFPTIRGSKCSGAIIAVSGLTGGFRGTTYTRTDGRTVRPGAVICDDPQTDESAKSPTQVDEREMLINGAVLGLAGPGQNIAAVMPCTVIAKDDLSDRLLNRDKNPAWQGERAQMLYGWPTHENLWEQYKKIRDDSLRAGTGLAEATAFYSANREAMDEGCTAAWPVRKNKDEISAIQHAMNLCFKLGKRAFFAEYQNDPQAADDDERHHALTADQIAAKANGSERFIVPKEATKLVAFVDVQKELLYYAILALEDDFTGHICDYGTYPDQHVPTFAKVNVKRTLMDSEHADRFEESLVSGLGSLCSLILSKQWQREDGGIMSINRCLVDAHWGESTHLVRSFCRTSAHAAVLTPSFGTYIGARSLPLSERVLKRGDRSGTCWVAPAPKPGMPRHCTFDTNFYKTFLQSRLAQKPGGGGNFSIFGDPEDHPLLTSHLTSEYSVETIGRGRTVFEWAQLPSRPDNDLLDCVVGCCVAGSMEGARLAELPRTAPIIRRKIRMSDLQKARNV